MRLIQIRAPHRRKPNSISSAYLKEVYTLDETCTISANAAPSPPVCPDARLDLVFVLDSSGSIRNNNPADGSYDNWDGLLEFVISRILPIGANMKNIHLGLVKVLKDSFVLPANHTIVKKHN